MLQTREIVASRLKITGVLLGSLAFVSIAALLPSQRGDSDQWRLWGGAFFGICAVVFCWLLIRPQRLTFDPEGFTVSGGLVRSPKKIAWRSIEPFFVDRLPRGGKMIGFNFRPEARPDRTLLMKLNGRLGAEGSLPKLWPGSPDQVVEELNAYRKQALETRSTHS
jgi:hypothetical protein